MWIWSERFWALVLSCATLAACIPSFEVYLPTAEERHRSLLLAVETDGEPLRIFGVPIDGPWTFAMARQTSEARLTTVLLERTLEELQLDRGLLTTMPRSDCDPVLGLPTRFLFDKGDLRGTSLRGGQHDPWRENDLVVSDTIRERELAPLSLGDCVSHSGCLAQESNGLMYCRIPCALSAQPEAPAPPELGCGDEPCAMPAFPERVSCTADKAQFLHEASCGPVGSPCPAGIWPEDPPVQAIYVQPGARPQQDGTRDLPYSTIAAALAVHTRPLTIVLAKGEHEVQDALPDGTTIHGACTGETAITSTIVIPDRAALRNLTVRDHGIVVSQEGDLTLERIVVDSPGGSGLDVQGTVTATTVVIRSAGGVGLQSYPSAQVHLNEVLIENGASVGIDCSSRMHLSDIAVVDNGWDGVSLRASCIATVTRMLAERNVSTGIVLQGEATLDLEDAVFRYSRPRPDGDGGTGIVVKASALNLRRVVIDSVYDVGLFVYAATLVANDLVIRNTLEGPTSVGQALMLQADSVSRLDRVLIEESAHEGIQIERATSTVLLNSVIKDIRSSEDQRGAVRIHKSDDTTIERMLISNANAIGLEVHGYGEHRLNDIKVERVGLDGIRLSVFSQNGSADTVELTRAEVDTATVAGFSFRGGHIIATDLRTRNAGRGMHLELYFGMQRLDLDLSNIELLNSQTGMSIADFEQEGFRSELTSVSVDGAQACIETRGCSEAFTNALKTVRFRNCDKAIFIP